VNECQPTLERVETQGVAFWTDPTLRLRGVVVAFTERGGGVSAPPFAGLNLAAHVADEPGAVDENRMRALSAVGLEHLRQMLVTAEQVHGAQVADVGSADAGRGAFADGGARSVEGVDALVTTETGVPLMLCFADCVPIVLVSPGPGVAVVHAGWRGALAGIAGTSTLALAASSGVPPGRISAYIGPHIGACHYQVSEEIMSHFVNTFGTVARAGSGGLDLGSVVAASLISAGVDPCNIACLGECTAETTDRFFSHRAEAGLTGRHGALACILP
jgi:hypothetical protein